MAAAALRTLPLKPKYGIRMKRIKSFIKTYIPIPALVMYALALICGLVQIISEGSASFSDWFNRYIGAFAAEMGGLDALAFTGGIGENDAASRREICESLGFLGVEIDESKNLANERMIGRGRTAVFVIPADEERVVADNAWKLLNREA